ncbi:hydantoinase/oxoprolinase family protein [Streptomyces iconiensis]|uniref:Hydantoinase/oxoprolinase family protein n=1 Tax=Streptomyces iconiensis TaxID=1384038 RepID=A0ABT6ZRS3_9ACTN|nr:hydantoinase/oxoprolinase family protein [Streptomyces iconiensis]MDJ1131336.1 hydantoinase/oxoprolinase family protein [Streptomyces iconiensis]
MRLGIDIGRATSVAVLVERNGRVTAEAAVPSRAGAGASVTAVLQALGAAAPGCLEGNGVEAVCLTTDFARVPAPLGPVAVLRISPGSHPALAPLTGWPDATARAVGGLSGVADGGSSMTGRQLAPLDRDAVREFAERAAAAGRNAFALCAAGAAARAAPELTAAEILAATVPGARISLSHEIGGSGLRERENATVMNAALWDWAETLTREVGHALHAHGLSAPVAWARNDGGLVSGEYFRRYPVIASASTAACALRGAAAPAGADRAVVVDAGAYEVRCAALTDGEPEPGEAGLGPGGVWMEHGLPRMDTLPKRAVPGRDGNGESDRGGEGNGQGKRGGESWNGNGGESWSGGEEAIGGEGEGEGDGDLPARVAWLVAGVTERAPGGALLYAGGAARAAGAPEAVARGALRATAYGAARGTTRVELERVVVAAGDAEFARLRDQLCGQALTRAVAAGADPDSVRVDRVTHSPVSYLPRGVHRVRVSATGDPAGTAS